MVRFSHRTTWPTALNRLTSEATKRRERGQSTLDLTLSNPTEAGISYPPELLSPLAHPASLRYEPEALGLPAARAALARWFTDRGLPVAPGRVALTASSSESYGHLFHMLADPGDEVLIPAPSYPLFSFLADLTGVTLKPYPLRYDGAWFIDLAALQAALTPRSRAILVVSPNNPTGSYVKPDEARALRSLAASRGLALISDEVFLDYPLGAARSPSLLSDDCLTFVLGGLSKLAGLPQLKLGWVLIGGPSDAVATATERLETIADTFLSVGTPVQHALPSLLQAASVIGDQIRARTRHNLATLRAALASSTATLLDVEGGWYATVQMPATRPEEDWALGLLDLGALAHPGHFFDFDREPFLIVSLLPTPETFAAGAAALRSLLDGA